jgi:nucleotide-binding universal stress UspA family protein
MDLKDNAAVLNVRRAIVPLDGSMVAEAILPSFLPMAQRLGLEVVLVRIVPTANATAMEDKLHAGENIERLRQEAIEYLRSVAALPLFGGLRVITTVRTGEAAVEIIQAARELHADLIAMTTHGRTGLRRLLFGSVAEAVLRAAHVPVVVVRATEAQVARRVA